jgi:CBS domain-containing protein
MTDRVRYVLPDTPVAEAAKLMRAHDVGLLPVVRDGRVVGVLTDRDIVVRSTAEARDPSKATACSVMTESPVFCYDDEDVSEAARLMKEKQVRRLIVLNRDEQVAGVCSLGNLATTCPDEAAGDVLTRISEPSRS